MQSGYWSYNFGLNLGLNASVSFPSLTVHAYASVSYIAKYNARIKTYIRDVNAVKKASADTCRVSTRFNRAVESFWPHEVADMKSALLADLPRTSDDDRLRSRCQYEELVSFRRLIVGAVCIWQDCWNLLQTCKRKSAVHVHQPYLDHVSLDVSSLSLIHI